MSICVYVRKPISFSRRLFLRNTELYRHKEQPVYFGVTSSVTKIPVHWPKLQQSNWAGAQVSSFHDKPKGQQGEDRKQNKNQNMLQFKLSEYHPDEFTDKSSN